MHLPRFLRGPEIVVPRWRQLPSGLFVPSSVADHVVAPGVHQAVPEEFRTPTPPVAIVERLPTSADQMIGALNEEELGLPASSLEDLLEWGRLLPLEPAMLLLARIAAAL